LSYAVKEIFLTLQAKAHMPPRGGVLPVLGLQSLERAPSRIATPATCVFATPILSGTDGTLGGRYASAKALADTVARNGPERAPTATWC